MLEENRSGLVGEQARFKRIKFLIKKAIRLCVALACLFVAFMPQQAYALAEKGIKNNGLEGLYIDINDSIFKQFMNYGYSPYLQGGCGFYASARVKQITGKGNMTYNSEGWWGFQASNLGFSKGQDFSYTYKALACYSNHISVIEGVLTNGTILVSEGSYDYQNKYNTYGADGAAPYGGCIIHTKTLSQIKNSEFLGFVYLGVPLIGAKTYAVFDLNGYLDGVNIGDLGAYGTVDVYINGTRVANDVCDYYTKHEKGTSYSITDIKANPGYEYLGVKTGNLSGTINSGDTIDIRLSFARQGNLLVQGNLDGVADNSLSGYGTFDVYINNRLDASNCTSYNKQWPRGTTYEIKNIQAGDGKNYNLQSSANLSGTITSNTQSKAVIVITTDGTATTEWQEARVLPGNLNPEELDIEYKHTYIQKGRTSPGNGWTMIEEGPVQYENDGAPYESDNPLPTSAERVLVGHYYFHYCNNGENANYYKKDYLPVKHTVSMSAMSDFTVEYWTTDGDGSGRKVYRLIHKSGQWAGGYAKCGTNGSMVYYEGDVYQNKKAYRINTYRKISEWTETFDSTATSYSVRWRYKGGVPPVPPEEYTLIINGWLDGAQSDYIFYYGSFDLYADGELVAEDCTGIEMTFDHNPVYSIENIRTAAGKRYDGVHQGKITGEIPSGHTTVTLAFTTIMDVEEDWTEVDALPEGMDLTGCDLEYRNHYTTTGRTSPGSEWTLYAEGPVQYENDGAPYESDNPLPTSAERVLVGHYYFHYCNNGEVANYYRKDYLPIKHTVSMSEMSDFTAEYWTTDGDGSGRKVYHLIHKSGQWAGGYAKCGTNGSLVYYEGNVYQNRKPYRINTYVRDSDWTTERDSQASSVSIRIRLKQYAVYLYSNGGAMNYALSKIHDQPLAWSEYVPEKEDHVFAGWNTEADGTGDAYDAEYIYTSNAPLELYAQWTPIPVVTLPGGTEIIEEEAFAGSGVRIVRIPSGCTTIQAKAFADCSYLEKIYIPETVTYIDATAFDGVDSLIIAGEEDSAAELYASLRDWITFKANE